jgi:hypothetical protein
MSQRRVTRRQLAREPRRRAHQNTGSGFFTPTIMRIENYRLTRASQRTEQQKSILPALPHKPLSGHGKDVRLHRSQQYDSLNRRLRLEVLAGQEFDPGVSKSAF